jgi:3-oxochol-4-en-24-oyl-CoA dehydrogenase
MDELLSSEQGQLRDSAARLCADHGGAKRARQLRGGGEELDRKAWRAMQEVGWLSALVPEQHGGLGLGVVELYVLLEQIGRHVVMAPLLESAAVSRVLGQAGSRVAGDALQSMLSGERLIVPALEADGWNFRRKSSALDARQNGNRLQVSGVIAGVPFAPSANNFLAAVQNSSELLLCLVPSSAEGCHVVSKRTVDGASASELHFKDTPVDETQIVARGATAQEAVASLADLLALGASIQLLGLAESALALTLEHIKTRKQFGHPLGSFQTLQHRVVDNFVDLELDRALLYRICVAWDQGTASPPMIAAAKARMSRSAADMMRTGLQLHGAIGYTDEHDIGILFKRALVLGAIYGNEFSQSDRFARLTQEAAS